MRTGHTVLPDEGTVEPENSVWVDFAHRMAAVMAPMAAAFSLTMLAATPSGDAYTLPELTAMYREAGFGDVTAEPIPMAPHTVVVGRAL